MMFSHRCGYPEDHRARTPVSHPDRHRLPPDFILHPGGAAYGHAPWTRHAQEASGQ